MGEGNFSARSDIEFRGARRHNSLRFGGSGG
jgi:hypothetical protein